jgi:hypothetical protein
VVHKKVHLFLSGTLHVRFEHTLELFFVNDDERGILHTSQSCSSWLLMKQGDLASNGARMKRRHLLAKVSTQGVQTETFNGTMLSDPALS